MAKEIKWTVRANLKFNSIIAYLERKWGKRVTEQFVRRTYTIVELIAERPELGTLEDPDRKIRGFLITRHNRIFYRITDTHVIILNIFDTRSSETKL